MTPITPHPEERLLVVENPCGKLNIKVRGEEGKWITLYSQRNIAGELESFVNKLRIPEDRIPVLLGLGLGYHLREFLKNNRQPVIVVERDEGIFRAAVEADGLSDLLENPNIFFVVERRVEEALQEISQQQLKWGLRGLFLVKHPPSIRCFPSFYGPLCVRLERAQKVDLGPRLQYEKFKEDRLRILLINSQYLMMGEIVHAIQSLGHALQTIIIEREAEIDREKFIGDLLEILMKFKPDFILTVNHLGFDREGIVTELLTNLRIPFASWFVDSPMLIIKHYAKNLSPFCAIFLWDQDYLADMRALGFDKVHYLPLAADPYVFRPLSPDVNPFRSQAVDVSFVGNSMVKRVKAKMEKLGIADEQKEVVERIAREYAQGNWRNVFEVLGQDPYKNDPLVKSVQNGRRVDFEAMIMYQATLKYRLDFIQKLAPFHPVVRGDEGWRSLLNDSFHIGGELSYYYDLNYFYNVSKINFNVTSTQMRNAVNQRVFDVPAAGQFLLTDFKKQLESLLEIGKEIVCYRDPEEIPELVNYYLAHDSERGKVAERGRQRILAEHTYTKRVGELGQWMRKHFKEGF